LYGAKLTKIQESFWDISNRLNKCQEPFKDNDLSESTSNPNEKALDKAETIKDLNKYWVDIFNIETEFQKILYLKEYRDLK